jgi:hypothetical protein
MYRSLNEAFCAETGVPLELFKIQTPEGVKKFSTVDEALKVIK